MTQKQSEACQNMGCQMVCPPAIPSAVELGIVKGVKIVLVTYPDRTCLSSLAAHYAALYQSIDPGTDWIRLVDCTGVTNAQFSGDDLKSLTKIKSKFSPSRCERKAVYFCGENRLAYGISRMMMSYGELDGDPTPVVVCRTRQEVQKAIGGVIDLPFRGSK